MLKDTDAVASLGVKDFAAARRFYTDVLGLTEDVPMGDYAMTYRAGNTSVFVYQSEYGGTNQATAVIFNVGSDVAEVVRTLREKGATFEHYDNMPDTVLEGDLHVSPERKLAWLKDPSGNIIAIAGN